MCQGFNHFSFFCIIFVLAILATSCIRVNGSRWLCMKYITVRVIIGMNWFKFVPACPGEYLEWLSRVIDVRLHVGGSFCTATTG